VGEEADVRRPDWSDSLELEKALEMHEKTERVARLQAQFAALRWQRNVAWFLLLIFFAKEIFLR
jgi:hypothetical protein